MGYMQELDNIFIVLILALICSIFTLWQFGILQALVLMIKHCALGIQVAAFVRLLWFCL